MKVFYDFEFLENGETIVPASVGMASDDGRTLYCVNSDFDWSLSGSQMDWLNLNVKPHLFNVPDGVDVCNCSLKTIASNVKMFLSHFENFELWGYYSSYDHVALAQLFGPMVNWPFETMYTNDIKQLMSMYKIKKNLLPKNSKVHNAMYDALWTKESFYEIQKLITLAL